MIDPAHLDDKTYRQIRDSAVSQIPALTDCWTDHNPSDTGIMLLELLAAMLEQQNFYQSQVGERFFVPYLRLMDSDAADASAHREQLAKECAQIWVAVTPQDYEALLLKSPFSIHWANASVQDGVLVLKIVRKEGILDANDLMRLRAYLEEYRMIGVRLRIVQVEHAEVDIVCHLRFDPTKGREGACRERVRELLEAAAKNKREGKALSKGHFLIDLLSIAGVSGVDGITFLQGEKEILDALWQTDLSPTLRSVRIALSDVGRGGDPV